MPKVLEGRKCPDCGHSLVQEEGPYPRVRCTGDKHAFDFSSDGIPNNQLSREERLAHLEKVLLGQDQEPFQMSERGRKLLKEFFGEAPGGQKPDDPQSILMQMAEHNATPSQHRLTSDQIAAAERGMQR